MAADITQTPGLSTTLAEWPAAGALRERLTFRPVVVAYLCFFLSGVCGLVYEVLWSARLAVVFGHSTYADTTVLAVFMGGLALGAALFGRRADRWKRPLFAYGVMELLIAALAVIAFYSLDPIRWLYGSLAGSSAGSQNGDYLIRILLSAFVLIVPTALLGGTLPVLCRALTRTRQQTGIEPGRLYSLNTFGALLGCALAGFVLLPLLGQQWALGFAVGGNILVGIVALLMDRWRPDEFEVNVAAEAGKKRPKRIKVDGVAMVLLAATFLMGFCTFSYEVAWARLVGLMIGSSAFSFSTMLVTVLAGIAGGSLFATRLQRRREPKLHWLATIQIGAAAMILPLLWAVEIWPVLSVFLAAVTGDSSPVLLALGLLFCVAVMFPASFALGMGFPITVGLYTRSAESVGRRVGMLYAVNTIGAILGATVAGLVVLPRLGLHTSFLVTSMLLLASAAAVASLAGMRGKAHVAVGLSVLLVATLLWTNEPWNPALVNSGPIIYADARRGELKGGWSAVHKDMTDHKLLFAADGISSSVAAFQSADGHRHLRVNGKVDASTAGDMTTQVLLGYLPSFARPQAKECLVIGFGSGVTVGALAQTDCQRIDCVEMEPAVIVCDQFFRQVNHNCLDDSRVEMFFNDGRNHLETTDRRYDLIITEPSNPWIAGIASLFTREFYQLSNDRLRPSGVMAQWLQNYQLDWQSYCMVLATFADQFRHVQVHRLSGGDTLLLGSQQPIRFDLKAIANMAAAHSTAAKDLASFAKTAQPLSLLQRSFALSDKDIRALVAGVSRRNTDDHLRLQYMAAWSRGQGTSEENRQQLWAARSGLDLPLDNAPSRAQLEHPDHLASLLYQAAVARKYGRADLSAALLRRHLELDDSDWRVHHSLAQALEHLGQQSAAASHYAIAERLDPKAVVSHGRLLLERGQVVEAEKRFAQAVERMPGSLTALKSLVRARVELNRPDEALALVEKAMQVDPMDAEFERAANKLKALIGR
ncbi:MAG: fused MFS/spermidine synthase [Pirellulaceae bacterium]|nr:fused MFS/spermidine synthase [Pirellulaceae bacterium]